VKKGKPIVLILVALLAVGGGAAWYLHLLPIPGAKVAAAARPTPPPPPAPAVPVQVPELVTNLADPGQQRYIQLSMTVDLNTAADAAKFTTDMPAVENAVLLAARSETAAALGSVPGVAAFKKLLADAFDKLVGDPKGVRQIYFTQFVVQ
jgi:flagellar FliL protein